MMLDALSCCLVLQIGLFVIVAVASVAAKAEPKPDVIAYSAPAAAVVATAPVASSATFFEQSFHGNFAPVVAASGYPTAYLAPPLAYSYPAYEPFVATAPAAAVLLK